MKKSPDRRVKGHPMTHQYTPTLSVLAIAALVSSPLHADVKPNPLFTDGAVLQRGQPVPVWGTARDGEKVTVEIDRQKVSTTAADGKWSVSLKPLKEGGSATTP
jgi:sialate O-acetylesterase